MADVARHAGVSIATVSRALRDAAVAPATRERVLRSARELEYVTSPAGSGLSSGRTKTVALVVPFAARWFFSEVIVGAETALREAGLDMLLYNIGRTDRERFFATLPLRRRVDAAIVVASSLTPDQQHQLRSLGIPLSLLGSRIEGFPSVRIDDEHAAATAGRHLVGLGHRRVAMICGDPSNPVGTATTARRRAGFTTAIEAAGICGPEVVEEEWGITGGGRAMGRILGQADLPTAIFAESDEMAFGAMHTLRRAGIGVPDRISVVGVDDHELAMALELTTVAQPVKEQGAAAARALLHQLTDSIPPSNYDRVLPTRLVVRRSSAPPPP
jgi:DNA-binding LacI/PurR family transcriptional regulator